MKKSASIIIRRDKAFIPIQKRTTDGLYLDSEPVFVSDLDKQRIITNLAKVLEIGNPEIIYSSGDDRKGHINVIPKATGAKSWKELGRTAICYSLYWASEEIHIEMSRVDKQGRWEYDPNKRRILSIETPLSEIVQIILDDYHSRQIPLSP